MRRRLAGTCVAAVSALLSWSAGAAGVPLHDRAGLETTFAARLPCCVVDGRDEVQRGRDPIAGALPFRHGMKIDPEGWIVIVADTDARAVAIGTALVKGANAKHVVAVKGGAATWRAVELPDPTSFVPQSFVIPSDTCQNAPPLQDLSFDKP